jgi:hypothetical protein
MSLLNLRRILSLCLFPVASALPGSAQAAPIQFAPATELISPNSSLDSGPSLSSDGLTLYFASSVRTGGQGLFDIWTATRSTRFGLFGPAVNLGATVNSSLHEVGPSISLDGLSLFFHSGPAGFLDLYVATRATTNDGFGTPVNLGAGVNSSFNEANPDMSADGLTLVFQSDRPGGFSDQDLYIATRPNTSLPFAAAANLGPTINGFAGQGSASLSADSLSLFFAGGDGLADLFVSTRASLIGSWGAPVNLGPNVNGVFSDDFGDIAWDGLSIVFASERTGQRHLYEAAVVPEPTALLLLTFGAGAMLTARRKWNVRP